jgi:hypothetical protein
LRRLRLFVLGSFVASLLAAGGATIARPAGSATPKELKSTVASAISAEKAALRALDSDPAKARSELQSSLSQLKGAAASAPGAGGAAGVSDLNQAIQGDEIALQNLGKPGELGRVRAKINIAIVRKEAAEQVFATAAGPEPPPANSMPINAAKGITAVFEQDFFATFYSVDQTNTNTYPGTVTWKLAPPADDPPCNGFLPTSGSSSINATQTAKLNKERVGFYDEANDHYPDPGVGETLDSVAVWWHADISEGGLCNHAGNAYQPTQYGHGGTVSVTVENKYWVCTASFRGTLSGGSKLAADAPEPGGYPNGWRGPATCTPR